MTRDRVRSFYTWDAENRLQVGRTLRRVSTGRFRIPRLLRAQYRYDALGRRVQKTVRQRRDTDVTTYVCAGAQVVTEYVNGSESQSYVYASYVDEPIALIAANGTTSYYHANHLFSVEAMTDAAGNLIETYDYDSHGAMSIADAGGVALDESSVGNAYGFTGRRLDAESGLYYFRARAYSPQIGSFISRDPGLRFKRLEGSPQAGDGYLGTLSSYAAPFIPNQLDYLGTNPLSIVAAIFSIGGTVYKLTAGHENDGTGVWPNPFRNRYDPLNSFSFSAGPGGECKNEKKCPVGNKSFVFMHETSSSRWNDIWGDYNEMKMTVHLSWNGGSLSGHTEATGRNEGGRRAWIVKSVNGHWYEKDYECECISKIPCVSVTVIHELWVDQPWPLFNTNGITRSNSFHWCADGTGGEGAN